MKTPSSTEETWRVPPSFSERMTRVHIQYQIVAHIRRGRFRVDHQISTVFAFTPITKPTHFSVARQLAYIEGNPLPGPDIDPAGWVTLEDVHMRGTIFNARDIDAVCTLSLARPLSYTRGSVIPFMLRMDCADAQALDLLSMPRAVDVRLRRHVSMGLEEVSNASNKLSQYGVPFEATVQDVRSAVWWAASLGSDYRVLSGEIHLPREVKPSFQIGTFQLFYDIVVHPLKAVAFVPEHDTEEPLKSQRVEIVTAFAPGPKPKVYCPNPPSYDDSSSVAQRSEFSLFHAVQHP